MPGFVLGFLLLAAVSCGGALYAAGIDTSRIAELRGQNVAWTPAPTPVQLAAPESAPSAVKTPPGAHAYEAGDRVRNVTASLVNIRSSPGYLGKPSGDVVAQAVPGQQVEIVDGPQLADGLTWWYVRLLPAAEASEGWIAEATASGVQILGE